MPPGPGWRECVGQVTSRVRFSTVVRAKPHFGLVGPGDHPEMRANGGGPVVGGFGATQLTVQKFAQGIFDIVYARAGVHPIGRRYSGEL